MADAPSVRESLEASFAEFEPSAPEPAAEPVSAPEPVETHPTEAPPSTDPGRPRDEMGRFAPKAESAPPKPAPGPAKVEGQGKAAGAVPPPSPAPAAKPVVPTQPGHGVADPAKEAQLAGSDKAPTSWRPIAREKWNQLPQDVREEWTRREKEMAGYVSRTEDARKAAQQVHSTLAPYETIARANGMDTMSFAGSVLQTAAVLQMGAPQQKAAALAQVIKSYGVDVEMLAAALDQTPMPQQGPQSVTAPPQPLNEDAVLDRIMQRAVAAKADQDLQTFLSTKPEFVQDVWQTMQLVIRHADAQKRPITFEQAYNRACELDEGIAPILAQRKAAEAAKTAQAATERARNAASSVRTQPTAAARAQPAGLRETLEQRAAELGIT